MGAFFDKMNLFVIWFVYMVKAFRKEKTLEIGV